MATVFENVRLLAVQDSVSISELNKREEFVKIEIPEKGGRAEVVMVVINGTMEKKEIALSDDLECAKIAPNVSSLFTGKYPSH